MVRQAIDLLGHPVGRERLKGLDHARVQPPPPLQQEATVGHLMRQGMLEGVFQLGEQAASHRATPPPAGAPGRGAGRPRTLRNGPEQGQGHLRANHGSGLEQAFLLRGQAVDACCQYGLHRRRNLCGRRGLARRYAPGSPTSTPVSTRVRTLSSRKKGLPSVRAIKSCVRGARLGSSPSRAVQELVGAGGRQRDRAAVACSTSYCPSRAGTPGGS